MNRSNDIAEASCGSQLSGIVAIVLLLLALPFHLLLIKILACNFRFENPRHIILFCLSVSDALQVSFLALVFAPLNIADVKQGTKTCTGLSYAVLFFVSLTFIVSSLTLVALSIERYIACFHSYRAHEWLTNKRVLPALAIIWICGVIGGGVSCIPNPRSEGEVILSKSSNFGIIFITVTLAVSFILLVIQSLLFRLARKKLTIVQPECSSPSHESGRALRKRQIKTAMVASVVALSYLICMLPGACITIAKYYAKSTKTTGRTEMLLVGLGMLNTLLNPFIYGFGMLDTRQEIFKDFKKAKNFLMLKLGVRDELDL